MKRIYLLFSFLLALIFNSGAAVLTITYDATQGVSGLTGATDVYMHSGANDQTGALNGSTWKFVVGNWGQSNGIGEMTNIGNNKWRISIDPVAYYSQAANGPVKGSSIKRIGLVFRNGPGNLEGKDANNSDIFIDLSGTSPAVFNSDGSPFGGVVATFSSTVSSSTTTISRYLTVWHINDSLKFIDTANFAVLSAVKLIADSAVVGCTGFARHPLTGEYYAIVRFQTLGNRCLGKVNPITGAVTVMGNLLDRFANMVFLPSGRLIGVTGEGALTPESLFDIDVNTATTTFIRTLGNGSSGEAIGYCDDNGMIYHRSGIGTQVFEKIDTVNFNVTPITQSGNATAGETYCLYYIGNKQFIATSSESGGGKAYYVDTNGVFTLKTLLNQPYKGFSMYSCVRNIVGAQNFCAGSSAQLTATAGATAYQWYKNGVPISGANSMNYTVTSTGKYNCFFTDACGSDSLTTGIVVQQNALPLVTVTGSSSFCEGSSAVLTGSGGGTSQWFLNGSLIPGATSNTYTVTQSGNYNMIKTNTNGCADSASVGKLVIMNPKPQLGLITQSNLLCSGDNSGTIDVGISSGTAPFIYSWSNGANTIGASGLAAGNYQLIVTDASSCKDTLTASLTEPDPIVVITNTISPTCSGFNDGSAQAIATGGTGALNYSWSSGGVGSIENNLIAGPYSIEVTDGNGCINVQNVFVLDAPAIVLQIITTNVSCAGSGNGTATAIATGGVGNFTYSWSNGVLQNSISSLVAGNYVAFVTDGNLCSSSETVTISEPNPVVINTVVTPASGQQNNGIIDLSVTGGVSPYTFSWSNGSTDEDISNLSPGIYSVDVTDANGCLISSGNLALIGVGIFKDNSNSKIGIYPNPNNGNFRLTSHLSTRLFIYNSLKQLVSEVNVEKGKETSFSLNLMPGVYFIKYAENANTFYQKFVVTNF